MKDNYNTYGVLNTKTPPVINPGDIVRYSDSQRNSEGKLIKVDLYGVWDGEKVSFKDKQNTVVRTTWWLDVGE